MPEGEDTPDLNPALNAFFTRYASNVNFRKRFVEDDQFRDATLDGLGIIPEDQGRTKQAISLEPEHLAALKKLPWETIDTSELGKLLQDPKKLLAYKPASKPQG